MATAGSLTVGRRKGRSTTATVELEAFCRREYPRLVASLGLMCGDPQVAEDLAQETLVRVWDHWSHVATLESPGGWAHHVAMNLARSHLRRRGAERRANRRHGTNADTAAHASPEDASLQAALFALPVRDRQVIVLRFYLQFSVAETAATLGMPEGTVKTSTARALGLLRRVLGDAWEVVDDA